MNDQPMSFVRRALAIYTSAQFLRFLVVGVVAAGLHWASRFLFNMAFDFAVAVVMAYAVGLAVAYGLNRVFVFPNSARPMRQEVIYFVGVNVAAFPIVLGLSLLLGDHLLPMFAPQGVARAIGHAIAVASPVLLNFAAHKFFTFRDHEGDLP